MSRRLFLLLLALFLAGCASDGRNLRPGVSDETAVRAEMGPPAETVALASGGQAWFYPRGPLGRLTYRVELAPDGKVRRIDQALEEYNFDRIVKGKTTANELREMLGSPFLVRRLRNETVWEYRYLWGLDSPWTLYVGIGPDNIVTGQSRYEERDGGHPNPM